MGASVKVMLSYDYCHFEISESTDDTVTTVQIDEMRKECQRLADKAVRQYQIAKGMADRRISRQGELETLQFQVTRIMKKPEGDRTVDELAKIKTLQDRNWAEYINQKYDYEDDWGEGEQNEEPV